jgi:hypothetical protein
MLPRADDVLSILNLVAGMVKQLIVPFQQCSYRPRLVPGHGDLDGWKHRAGTHPEADILQGINNAVPDRVSERTQEDQRAAVFSQRQPVLQLASKLSCCSPN